MQQIEFSSPRLKERYVRMEHASGLSIYVFPKKLTGIYALLATDFGSIDNAYLDPTTGKTVHLPDGIAHFLEHKLFENEDGSDSLMQFSALGADANAYTSYNRTAYLFSCTEKFSASLEELLRFVTHPHFTDKSVKKEIGIISEEIRMIEDNPWDRGFQLLLTAMYREHPLRNNICGTQESIRRITPSVLYDCHRVFYDPSHLTLVVCGDVTCDEVWNVVERSLPTSTVPTRVERVAVCEPQEVCDKRTEARMQVSKPIFFIGFKDREIPTNAQDRIRRDAAVTLLNEILFSRSGEFYSELFESGVLNPSFSCGYSIAEGFAFNCISGESDTPDVILDAVGKHVAKMRECGISNEELERARRVLYADEIRAYDSTEEIANRLLSFVLDGVDLFSYPELLESITKEELHSLLDTVFDETYRSVSVIYPLQER